MEPQTVDEVAKARIPVLKKLQAIMTEVGFIEKDKTNDFHKYAYASEEAIKKAIHASLVKNGVIFTLNARNPRIVSWGNDKAQLHMTVLECEYTFFDVETGSSIGGYFPGAGSGRDDKGVYAAITGAIKYILTSNLLIPTGTDPEADGEKPKAGATRTYPLNRTSAPATASAKPTPTASTTKPASQRQIDLIAQLGKQKGVDVDTTGMTSAAASAKIEEIMKLPNKA